VAVTFSPRDQRLKAFTYTMAGMLLGVGLSSFYFLSALAHAKHFPVSRLPLWSYVEGHLLTLRKLLDANTDGFIRLMGLTVVDMITICLVCSVFVFAKGQPTSKKAVSFWLMVCIIPVLLVHGRSAPIWHMCAPFFAAIQYPWRLNIVLCIATLAIVAVSVAETPNLRRFARASFLAVLFVLSVPWLVSYANIWSHYRFDTPRQMTSVSDDDGWFLAWTAPGLDDASALRASAGPQIAFPNGTASILLWRPRDIEFVTNSSAGGQVIISQFYYPEWRAWDVDGRPIDVGVKMPEGLLEVKVRSGLRHIWLEIPIGPTERIGRWISGLSALLSVTLVWWIKLRGGNQQIHVNDQKQNDDCTVSAADVSQNLHI